MKKFIVYLIIFIIALPAFVNAESKIKFEWIPQEDSDVVGYMLFCREKGKDYDYDKPVWEGDQTFTHCVIDGLDKSKTYYFVMRTIDAFDNESHDSNEIAVGKGTSAGLGGDGSYSSTTSSCFIQSLIQDDLR